MKKNKKHCKCKFQDFKLPPCAEFLGNINPIIGNGNIIYRNNNRLYFFLCFNGFYQPLLFISTLSTLSTIFCQKLSTNVVDNFCL